MRTVLTAIRRRGALEVDYQSLSCLDLSNIQKAAIPLDDGMVDGKARITVRKALLYYMLKWLGPDTGPSARKRQDQESVLLRKGAPE